ncbi:MAG: acetyl-coenzyme A synthetase N-terminal domain-containing protein, partial [Thiotrichales bacterium]
MSSNIESVMHETRVFEPSAEIKAAATINAEKLADLHARAAADHAGFWADLAREELTWHKPFSVALDESNAPMFKWFADGELNVSYNCLDRHAANQG